MNIRIVTHTKLLSRRNFFRLISAIMAGFGLILLKKLISRQELVNSEVAQVKIDVEKLTSGAHFIDDVIVVKSEEGLNIFSNHCTHAGCKINAAADGRLQCPCHGSEFDLLAGNVLKGPAAKPLRKLAYKPTNQKGVILIHLE